MIGVLAPNALRGVGLDLSIVAVISSPHYMPSAYFNGFEIFPPDSPDTAPTPKFSIRISKGLLSNRSGSWE